MDPRVERMEREDGGFWIYLKYGWQSQDGDHAIVEDTKGKAIRMLRYIRPCECAECHAWSRAK